MTEGPSLSHRASTWSFMSTRAPDVKLSDHGVGVPARQEVQFKDGLCVWLSRVTRDGAADLYLRDLGADGKGQRIDLRNFIPDVERELPLTSTRDVAGFISISLRLRFATAQIFLDEVARSAA